ncbi:hypothetical protein ACFQH6_09215 [Halobacteriaceae archaeon GCM10025711]
MIQRLQRLALFSLYQASLALGILMLPIALLTRRAGVVLPVHRVVKHLEQAYRAHR